MTATADEFTSPEREHHPVAAALIALVPALVVLSAVASLLSMA
jgi:hypothetical protein